MPDNNLTAYKESLRPTFTALVVKSLQSGRSVNLIGAEGAGRERLLEDIRRAVSPDTAIAIASLKSYRYSYENLIREIWWQLGKPGEKPANLSELIEQCEQQNRQTFLCLHHFDALFDSIENDAKYDSTFLDALNFCKNRPNIALLCVTQKSYTNSVISINNKSLRNSLLDLEQKPLPALTQSEIIDELERTIAPDMPYLRHNNLLGELVKRIQANPKPYDFLTFVADKFAAKEDADLPFKQRLPRWEKAFAKLNPTLTPASLNHIQEKFSFWRHALGFAPGKAQSRWKLLLKIAIAVVTSLGTLGLIKPELLKKLLELLNLWKP